MGCSRSGNLPIGRRFNGKKKAMAAMPAKNGG
jgi:hypothetical protein